MKKALFAALCLIVLCSVKVKAQVTVGKEEKPEKFSVLQLEGDGKKGLRIPQLTTEERDKLSDSLAFENQVEDKAKGLTIYNTTIKKLEYWNGKKWIQL